MSSFLNFPMGPFNMNPSGRLEATTSFVLSGNYLLRDTPLIIYRDAFLAVYNSNLAKLERKQPRRRAPCKDRHFSHKYKPPPHPASCKVVEHSRTSKIHWQEKSARNPRRKMWDAFWSTKPQVRDSKYGILVHHPHNSNHNVLLSTHHSSKWLRCQHYYL